MELWALLEIAFAIATAAGCFVLIIGEMHMSEKTEHQEWWGQLEAKIADMR
jgi:hypothetical protein